MKKVSWSISKGYADSLLNTLAEKGFEARMIPGCLLDNWICYIGENALKLGRFKLRKYLIIREIYKNEWSSGLELILTDDESTWKAWERHYENSLKEKEIEGEIA